MRTAPAFSVLILCSITFLHAAAQEPTALESYIRLHYVKQEVSIPMRDGVKLLPSIYSPRDTSKKYPLLMKWTPYSVGPYGV